MKLRLKTKGNHDSERIRLKEQTFLQGLYQFTACWTEICISSLSSNLIFFNSTARVVQHMHPMSIIFFVTKPLHEQNGKKTANQAILGLCHPDKQILCTNILLGVLYVLWNNCQYKLSLLMPKLHAHATWACIHSLAQVMRNGRNLTYSLIVKILSNKFCFLHKCFFRLF